MWIKVTDYLSNVDNNNKKVLVNTNNVDCIFPARSIGYDGKTAISFCGGKISENCIVVNESLKEIETMISDADKEANVKIGGEKMTNAEAIETLRANYPDACFEQLREAVDVAIKALKAQDTAGDTISRQWLLDCINNGWIKFDTDKDANRFIHLVRDIAPPAQ